MVWSHSPVDELLVVTWRACVPLLTGVETTLSPLLQVQPLRVPVSKPPLLTRLPPAGVAVGVVPIVGVGVGVVPVVGVGVEPVPQLPISAQTPAEPPGVSP